MWDDRIMARRGMTWDKLIIEHLESRGIKGAFYQDWSRHVGGFVVFRSRAGRFEALQSIMIYPNWKSGIFTVDPIESWGRKTAGRMEDPDFLDNLDKVLEHYNVELLYE